jgi:uncharacterized protein
MNTVVIASLRSSAGKTSLTVGLAEVLRKNIGYMKPFGDRMLYSKKRLWDYDAALLANLYAMDEAPEDMSIGFDHSKLRYMYDQPAVAARVRELAGTIGRGKDLLIVEGGKSLSYGTSVHLDCLSLTRYVGGRLVFVISGDDDTILDDLMFIKANVDLGGAAIAGVVVNKVYNLDDFRETYLQEIEQAGIRVLGIIPNEPALSYFSLSFLADRLFAKVIAGESSLERQVKNIFIGAMSGNVAMQKPLFKKEDKLIITGGDRSDMIIAAIESSAAGVILTNNILPPPAIIARAEESGTPLLLVTPDTYQIARQIDRMEALLTRKDTGKIEILKNTIGQHVDVGAIMSA